MQITKTVTNPALTAEDWELFTFDETPSVVARVNAAAEALNKCFMDSVNAGGDRGQVESAVFEVMIEYKDTGAYDTEPRYTLNDLLDEVFGPE